MYVRYFRLGKGAVTGYELSAFLSMQLYIFFKNVDLFLLCENSDGCIISKINIKNYCTSSGIMILFFEPVTISSGHIT